MDVREKYVIQKVNRKEKSICPNCIHHNLCIAENNQPCFECNRFMDAHSVTVQEWISIKDRLPGHGKIALVFDIYGNVYGMQRDSNAKAWVGSRFTYGDDMVTHWMPLPEPPKGE